MLTLTWLSAEIGRNSRYAFFIFIETSSTDYEKGLGPVQQNLVNPARSGRKQR